MGNENSTSKTPKEDQKIQRKIAAKFVKQITSKKCSELVNEYNQLSSYRPVASEPGHSKQAIKNRYRDIECHEPSRVIIKTRKDEDNYIHANWIQAGNYKYICAQAPLGHTIDDFWLMVATEQVGAIVMLCDLVEEGQRKCADYWPHDDGGRAHYGDVIVENVSVGHSTLPKVQVTIMRITYEKKSHLLNHYQWLGWPDDGVPDDNILPYKLLDLAKDCVKPMSKSQTPAPIVVHCSAGVGRTGTLVALDIARVKLESGQSINVSKLVKELRNQRSHAIQGPLQYIYLCSCILQICSENAGDGDAFYAHKWLEKCHTFIRDYQDSALNH